MQRRLVLAAAALFVVLGGLAFAVRDWHSPSRGTFGPATTTTSGRHAVANTDSRPKETCAEAAARLGQTIDPNLKRCVFHVPSESRCPTPGTSAPDVILLCASTPEP